MGDLWFFYHEEVVPLEIKQGSVVLKGFPIEKKYTPKVLIFKDKPRVTRIDVIDALITPEVIILYTKQDPRNIPYKKCILHLERETGNGILEQIEYLSV